MAGKLSGGAIQSGTITTTQISSALNTTISAGGGPKISTIIYPGDDTAANTNGGQTLYITGSGFKSNSTVYINGNNVPSVSFISASNLSFTGPVLSAATYPVYVINPEDGATAILIPGLQVSGEPTWVTSATLAEQDATGTWNISLSATGDETITYTLAAGSSLPAGISLASNGVISGTLSSPPEADTTYNFTVDAIDLQNQSSSRAFSVTATTGEGVLFSNNAILIHADGTNNSNNHTFLDSSNNNFTITRAGNVSQGSFSPFSQTGWSGYFDGTGDYLTVANNSSLAVESGNFTIEGWIYTISGSSTAFFIMDTRNADDDTTGFVVYRRSTGKLTFGYYDGGFIAREGNTTIEANRWYHIAITRQSSDLKIFVNGVLDNSTTTVNRNFSRSANVRIAASWSDTNACFGYISNLRLLKGTALYTAGFTPPSEPLAPIANTSLLTLQSNRFIDDGPNNLTITRNGDTSIQPFSPFVSGLLTSNSHSVFFDGTGDYLNTPANAALTFGAGDLTLECWIYQTATSASTYRVIFGDDVYGSAGGYTLYSYNNALNLWKGSAGGGAEVIAPAGTINLNTWTHVAWTRSGSSNRLFINGAQVGSTTTDSTNYTGNIVYIAANKLGSLPFAGYISNVRIVKGTALYTSNFTPSTSQLTAVSNTSLLTCQSATLIDNSTNAFTITRNGDAAPRKFNPFGQTFNSNVAYSTADVGGSAYFDGTGDYLSISNNTAFDITQGDFTLETWVYKTGSLLTEIFNHRTNVPTAGYLFRLNANNTLLFSHVAGSTVNSGANSFPSFAWNHIALTRSGSTGRLFINGALVGSGTITNGTTASTSLRIGVDEELNNSLQGYLSNHRIIKGTALYTNPFVPPSAPFTNIANTSLLCNFTNAGIFDQTAKNVLECIGDAKVSTAQYKYGTGSIAFDGTGDYLLTVPTQDLEFGSGDFTIELWWYPTSTSRQALYHGSFGTDWSIGIDYSSTSTNQKIGIWASSNGSSWNLINADPGGNGIGTTTITQNAWNHIAYVRNGTTWMLFVNGNRDLNLTGISGSIVNRATSRKAIGAWWSTGSVPQTSGYIDDLRITRGYARYTSNFTAPTAKLKDK